VSQKSMPMTIEERNNAYIRILSRGPMTSDIEKALAAAQAPGAAQALADATARAADAMARPEGYELSQCRGIFEQYAWQAAYMQTPACQQLIHEIMTRR